jgi:hypothetical protein
VTGHIRAMLRRSAATMGLTVVACCWAGTAIAQSGSNATNYGSGAQLSVNERTGDITVAVTLVRLPGVVAELGASLALTYRSEDARSNIQSGMRNFGLPYGWSLGLSFIYNDGTSTKLNVDGAQTYQLDPGWTTSFAPPGETPQPVKTGLMQYNRADAHLKADNGSIVVGGIASAHVFTSLDGQVKYFSPGGLLLREADRFGNAIDYAYTNRANGAPADTTTSAQNALLDSITDTWGHVITIAPCTDPASCVPNETRVTLPDGRTVGWVTPNAYSISEIIDTEGMVTHLQWNSSTCGDSSYGNRVLQSVTLPVGGTTTLRYSCLDVCRAPSATSCTQRTSWSVVSEMIECPNNTSGTLCPQGSPNGDFQTTKYAYRTTEDVRNYTGYPRYSPFQPSVANADPLMSAPDAGSFTYTTVVSQHRATGETIHQVETEYNFLHLQQEQRIFVSDGSNLALSKVTSHCYPISDTAPTESCPLTTANYQNLPSNYQSPIVIGSCQYNVGELNSGLARRSTVTMTYDGFGNVVRKRVYHATGTNGIVSNCDRPTRLSSDGMRLVVEDHTQYDTPTTVGTDGYLELGAGSGHFGLALAQQSFVYLDEDDSGVGAHQALAGITGPVMVKLLCNELTEDSGQEIAGTEIKTSTGGLLATDAAPPTTPGIVAACDSPGWDTTVAPPKTTTHTYDGSGRALSEVTSWADGFSGFGGVSATTQNLSYAMTGTNDGEEGCGDGSNVLEITSEDDPANPKTRSVNRFCTLNGFQLAAIDGDGNTTLMQHSANGVTTKTTHADGTYVTAEHYYACPLAQDGRTETCPSTASAYRDCPFDSQAQKRNCVIKIMHSATPGASFADGVMSVTIKDGLGRVAEMLDNVGGVVGAGYQAMQTRSRMEYDDRGMLVSRSQLSGASNPLVYTSTNVLDAKLRPRLVCGPRGDAHEFVHDDVNQKTMTMFNGSDREGYVLNDSQKLTTIANCDLVAGQTTAGTGACPTVAADLSSADCQGDGYYTYTLHDGSGQEHSITAMAGSEVDPGASVTAVNGVDLLDGVSSYSADMLKYGYSFNSTNASGSTLTASSTFTRDVQGHVLDEAVSVVADGKTSTFASDHFDFNDIDQKVAERNKLSDLPGAPSLQETYTYTLSGELDSMTSYEGVTFQNYYDNRNRLVRHCFPTETGSEGEKMDLDPISGAILKVTRFTNPGACAADDSGDTDVVSETYTYTRFGAVESITYSDGTRLEWAYDPYQRVTCFADALATKDGGGCPVSPTNTDFSPDPATQLVSYRYWEDSDPYRRGLSKSKCRGVPDGNGGFATKCMDMDYYTPTDTGGSCVAALDGVAGAYAGMPKTETYCTGGSCLDDGGTLVYQTTHLYDDHRRSCRVESVDAGGNVILSSAYAYDQFDNVVHEENTSDLDPSTDSNYQLDNVYDGLLRLVEQTRTEPDGTLIERTTYEYDAASNLVHKHQEINEPGEEPSPSKTPTPTRTFGTPEPPTPAPTNTAAATATAAHVGGDDDGCQVQAGGASSSLLLILPPIFVLLRKRRRERAC